MPHYACGAGPGRPITGDSGRRPPNCNEKTVLVSLTYVPACGCFSLPFPAEPFTLSRGLWDTETTDSA